MRSPTPILDLETSPPASREEITFAGLAKALPAAVGLLILFFATMFLIFKLEISVPQWLGRIFVPVSQAIERLDSVPALLLGGLYTGLIAFLVVVIHEGGHAMAAALNRWPLAEFRVAPFSIQKHESGWKLRVSWKLSPRALVVANPVSSARFHTRIRVFALAGPMMNLVTGIVVLGMPWAADGSMLSVFAAILVLWSFILGLLNLVPVQLGHLELDGYIAMMVSRNPRKLAMRVAAFKMRDYVRKGKPLDAMNQRWVALAEASGRVSLQNRVGAWLAYVYWARRRQFDRAALTLERMLQASGEVDVNFKAILFAECSVLAALRGQKHVAQTWKARASEFFLPEYLRRRCTSYVAWVERDFEVAYREAVLAKDAVLKLDDRTQKAFMPSWGPWIELLDKERTRVTHVSTAGQMEIVFPYT